MPVIQNREGFRAYGPITHHRDRVFVDGHDVNVLLQLGHSDHLCESPGGDERPCREVELQVRYVNCGAA